MAKGKKEKMSLEEMLDQALVKDEDRPYDVPGNWVWTRLGDIIKVSSGKSLTSAKMVSEGTIPVYGGNGITGYHNAFNIEVPTIVIGRVGFYCGSVHFINENAWVTDNALIVSYSKEKLNIKFLYWLLSTIDLRKNDSSTAQPVISGSKIYKLEIPLPPFAEQQRIVNVIESLFEKLDAAKELVQNALDSFENRKAAILHKAFTGELTAKWREENGVSLDDWEKPTARDICEFITKGETPTKFVSTKGEIPFLKVYNIRNNKLDFSYNPSYIPREIHDNKMKRSKVFPNDIIMNIVGPPLQKVAIVTDEFEEWNINQAIAIFRVKEKVITKYLYYCLLCEDTLASVLADVRGVVGQSNISLEQCRNLIIPLPSIFEQKEIVRILDQLLDNEQQAKELCDVIEKIDLMKKAILARAFRGELGTNNPEEESAIELLKEVLREKI